MFKKSRTGCYLFKKNATILILIFALSILNNNIMVFCSDDDHSAVESLYNDCHINSTETIISANSTQKSCEDIVVGSAIGINRHIQVRNLIPERQLCGLSNITVTDIGSNRNRFFFDAKIAYSGATLDLLDAVILLI